MSRYEISRTNGSYGGLSTYHGLGDGRDRKGDRRRDWHKGERYKGGEYKSKKRGKESPFIPLLLPSPQKARMLEQKSIYSAQRAEQFERRGEQALTAGRDVLAQNLMDQGEHFQEKSERQAARAQASRLPYTDVPRMPKGILKQADIDLYDTPERIADQTAPMPEAIMGPLAPTTPTLPTTAPRTVLIPPRFLRPPIMGPQMGPQMLRPPMGAPQGPSPQGPRMLMGRISPANAAAATAALAASYFLFF